MRRRTATKAALRGATALLVPLVLAVAAPGRAATPVSSHDLPRLTAELAAATARAQQLVTALADASQQDDGLQVAFEETDQARADAQQALGMRARQVYMASAAVPLGSWLSRVADPDLQLVAHRGQQAALQVDQRLVDAVSAQTAQLQRLQQRADAFRLRLLAQARTALDAQQQAQTLYAEASALAAAERAAAVQAQLDAQRAVLDQLSTVTALALTPGQQQRAQAALAREKPVVDLLEATGPGIPPGYAPSGTVLTGIASWYGPGFIGNPTASGAPYDPMRLTCAHKTLPLGTVIHVSANGRSVNCLVDDRGPYVGDRILDMSYAGAQALGYSGLAHVTVEVLVPIA